MAKKNSTKKVEAKTKIETPKEIVALDDALTSIVVASGKAVKHATEIKNLPESVGKRVCKIHVSLEKSVAYLQKQLNGLGAKAEKAAAKEVRVAAAAGKKVTKLAKLVDQQKKLAERITKMQAK